MEHMSSPLNGNNASKWSSTVPGTWRASNSGGFIFAGRKGSQRKSLSLASRHFPQHVPLAMGWGAVVGKNTESQEGPVQTSIHSCMPLPEDNTAEQF